MEKVWLQSYPPGVAAEIDLDRVTTLVDLFDGAVDRYRGRPAYTNLGHSLTYDDLDRLSAAFASVLQHRFGLTKGERVAIMMPNVLQYPVVLFGVLRAGMTVVNVNPLYTARELHHQLADSGATVIVVLANFASVVERAIEGTDVRRVVVTQLGDLLPAPKRQLVNFVVRHVKKMVPPYALAGELDLRALLAEGGKRAFTPVAVALDDVAFLQYTGGTTGRAKGAILTHRNMGANVRQATQWIEQAMHPGEERIVTALPLYHIFALTANCLTYLHYGAENLLITNPRDIPRFIKEIADVGFTAITGVNTLFNALLNAPGFDRVDFSQLRLTLGGGMAVQRPVAERWQALTGCPLLEAYGLTETCPAVTINPLNLESYNGSIGLPIPSTEVCVRDAEGRELPVGERGELCIRGPQVMQGYWRRPEETASVLGADGWLRTGDVATIDEKGFVYIVDRMKDMIDVSGFNVYPNEIEEVVAQLEGVREVAAVGVPSAHSGEVVKVFLVCDEPGLTVEAVLRHCRENLTRYKVPKHVEFREELPKTNVGKILRRALREEARAGN
ncbi:MAG: AMP-binding protein [Gammaproteobacteria bacterium]|nr:AMP-binding protein [Gammaproteobacteria bacterium]